MPNANSQFMCFTSMPSPNSLNTGAKASTDDKAQICGRRANRVSRSSERALDVVRRLFSFWTTIIADHNKVPKTEKRRDAAC